MIKNIIFKTLVSSLLVVSALVLLPSQVQAGTDLVITCADDGLCDIFPVGKPALFSETNLLPGDTVSQQVEIINNDSDETCNLVLDVTDQSDPEQLFNLAEKMFAAITDGTTAYYGAESGGEAQAGATYQDLYDTATLSLGSLSPGASRTYTWYATFDINAGNDYQATETIFDFAINITCDQVVTRTLTTTNIGGGTNGGDGGSAPRCETPDMFPSGPANFRITNRTDNSVTLAWDAVADASEYVIFFSDSFGNGYSVPSKYVGSNLSYTINNISGGRWSFEVAAVGGNKNLCVGPRSSTTETVPGGEVSGRPRGEGGEVLGAQEEASPSGEASELGQVAGVTDVCLTWKLYLPWILLIAQAVLILASEYYFRRSKNWFKHYLAIGVTLASILIFYLVRECNCYQTGSWLVWLCRWYWVVSVLLTALLKSISYAFIEDITTK